MNVLHTRFFEELGGGNRPVVRRYRKEPDCTARTGKEKKKLDYFGSSIEKTGFVSEVKIR